MSILDLVIEKVKIQNSELGSLLEANKDVAYLGSIAPDIYFLAPDISDEQREILYWLLEMYDKIVSPITEIYEKYIKPVEDALEEITEPVEKTLDNLTCGILHDLGRDGEDIIQMVKDTIGSFLSVLVSKSINFFELFTPPIQKEKTEEDWYWFDMLHYRYTSDYVKKLVQALPRPDAPQAKYEVGLAYAMGHLTHIAADVTGHAYVNEIVGGPYRAHNRRHHIMENFMDVWTHYNYKNEDLIGAKLHRKFTKGELLDSLGTIRAVAEGILDPPERLEELFRYLERAFKDTYGDKPHPTRIANEFLTGDDISMAYWLNLAFFKLATDCLLPPIEPPHESLLEEINNRMGDLRDTLGDRPDRPDSPDLCWSFWEDTCDFSWDAFKDLMEFIWESVKFLGESLIWALKVLKDLLALIVCTIAETLVIPIKAILWLIKSFLAELYQSFRDALVIAGIALPSIDYLNNSPLGRRFTQSKGPMESFKMYPHRQLASGLWGGLIAPDDSHLEHPTTPGEPHLTMSGPYSQGVNPKSFIEDIPMDHALLDRFAQASTPSITREIEREIFEKKGAIGNAVDYAVELILGIYSFWKEGEDYLIPNWNLDSDRGYCYKCWCMDNPGSVAPDSNEVVVDQYFSDSDS